MSSGFQDTKPHEEQSNDKASFSSNQAVLYNLPIVQSVYSIYSNIK